MWCYKRRWMLTLSLIAVGVAWALVALRGFWYPSALAFGGAFLCALGSLRLRTRSRESLGTRLCVVAGLTSLSLVTALGAIWPSAFTVVALTLLPAFGFGLAALFQTSLIYTKRNWSTYFAYGSLVGTWCVLAHGVWLATSVVSGRVTI